MMWEALILIEWTDGGSCMSKQHSGATERAGSGRRVCGVNSQSCAAQCRACRKLATNTQLLCAFGRTQLGFQNMLKLLVEDILRAVQVDWWSQVLGLRILLKRSALRATGGMGPKIKSVFALELKTFKRSLRSLLVVVVVATSIVSSHVCKHPTDSVR